jgi:dTDP-glucose 4,6-dehydratase
VVDALRLAAEKGAPGDVFNIGAGPEGAQTVRSTVEAIIDITGAPASLVSFGDAVRSRKDAPYLVCDPSRARAQLGWRQQVSFEAGLKETIEWGRSQWHKEGSLRANS